MRLVRPPASCRRRSDRDGRHSEALLPRWRDLARARSRPRDGDRTRPSAATQSTSNHFANSPSGPSTRSPHHALFCLGSATPMWFGTISTTSSIPALRDASPVPPTLPSPSGRVHDGVIHDVVAVCGAPGRPEERGTVQRRHAQPGQIPHHRDCIVQRELLGDLKSIGRTRRGRPRDHLMFLFFELVGLRSRGLEGRRRGLPPNRVHRSPPITDRTRIYLSSRRTGFGDRVRRGPGCGRDTPRRPGLGLLGESPR